MVKGPVYDFLSKRHANKQALFLLLVDPDKVSMQNLPGFMDYADNAGVDGFLIGGSLVMEPQLDVAIRVMKGATSKPVISFPGGVHQICAEADALLFLSIISSRNADQLIGQHVVAAPIIRRLGLEAISTGYMIVESDQVTSTEFMSYSKPLPRHKTDIAVAHALAAELLGMKLLYLEAGSGARQSVPDEMITAITQSVTLPVIVGGGIRTPFEASQKVEAGASIIVIGNHFEKEEHRMQLPDFALAIHAPGTHQA
jgi:putative glycerol-1-phosphate prenyltransferase